MDRAGEVGGEQLGDWYTTFGGLVSSCGGNPGEQWLWRNIACPQNSTPAGKVRLFANFVCEPKYPACSCGYLSSLVTLHLLW